MNIKYMSILVLSAISGVNLYAPTDAEKSMQKIFDSGKLTREQLVA